ncbi:hypothetical protein [Actibacterium lipolyticum]|uniref:DUF1127 domain-containing protein n=1 Tax=Actibacterium lipolyticum TaxID=1524263 RepID=A0A238JUA0_9RHOB|nr:hypothetical protein [Actibacterium lipolyticum]SMX34258.1 hypothetical protein COL8621_01231 [Actibacterium lipolyticum]
MSHAYSTETGAQLDLVFSQMGQGFNAYLERRKAVGMVRELNALSDSELARRGLRRIDIVAHVAAQMGKGTLAC